MGSRTRTGPVAVTVMVRRAADMLGVSHARDFVTRSLGPTIAAGEDDLGGHVGRRQSWPAIGRLGPESKSPKRDVVAFAPDRINHRKLR